MKPVALPRNLGNDYEIGVPENLDLFERHADQCTHQVQMFYSCPIIIDRSIERSCSKTVLDSNPDRR